ncbi:methylase [bacterium]|nr:methylase [bacterium]
MAKISINRKKAAKEFAARWLGKGYEKGESQLFWIELLQTVYNVENISDFIVFEDKVHIDHTSFIDAYIPSTHVMIEQKSIGKDLRKPIRQSDGSTLTPFQQAKRYSSELPYSSRPRWIITCNFSEFLIYDMEKPHDEPAQILLEDLPDKFESLQFMIDSKKTSITPEEQVSLKAGELVGKLYDAILKQYKNPESAETLKSLNILCVRLVFLLYAEDAGIFPEKDMFGRYLAKFRPEEAREKLLGLFAVLNTKPENRDPYLSDDLAAFPYVNGGLFAELEIEIPRFNEEIVNILINKASSGFDWSEISPTIFGAVFESTLNPETRRKGGMHYTSIENIHKVIDPLFMDDLKAEFAALCKKAGKEKIKKLEEFRNKLANLKFLDPACGSGNFLTETYISLRRLENECLKVIHGSQMLLSSKDFSPIKVRISQFYGIEINDFAVTVAKTALWIAESQMMRETEEIVERDLDFLPLSTSATIVEGNALRMDWTTLETEAKNDFVFADRLNVYKINEKFGMFTVREPKVPYDAHYTELNVVTPEITERKFTEKDDKKSVIYDYIIGNPPFVGYSLQSERQKEDTLLNYVDENGKTYKSAGKIDYVANWYFKAAKLILGTKTRCAFVSTNSITQGEQVSTVWKPIFERFKIHIDFAYRTFKWSNETTDKKNMAAVHCVIIGFSNAESQKQKIIFSNDLQQLKAENINAYLIDCSNVFVESRSLPLSNIPQMSSGGKPVEGGHLIFTEEEKIEFLKKEPKSEKYFRPFMGSDDFINGLSRWCLWLFGVSPNELRAMPQVMKRIEEVRKFRLVSVKAATREYANYPAQFMEIKQPEGDYLMIPATSSENRRYIPIGYLDKNVVASNAASFVPNATLYHFGILTSNVHNAWMRVVCGRLEMRYRYSVNIVYNNFPWPEAGKIHFDRLNDLKSKIEQTAQAILDARAKYPDSSLADLYDETTMPPELRKAHKENDKAVMAAYGFNPKMSESEIVAELFKMYEKLTK